MMKNNKILSLTLSSLLLSACGGSFADKEEGNVVEAEKSTIEKTIDIEAEAQKWIAQDNKIKSEVTGAIDHGIDATKKLKEQKMIDLKNKFKNEISDWQKARVQYFDLEGGFYGIITDSGIKLLPMNLTKDFTDNGAIIRIKGKVVKDVMTVQQWGLPFTITDIELIAPGNKPINPVM